MADNKILDYEASSLPDKLYVPVPPADLSTNPDDTVWKVATYTQSDDASEFDIEAYYDLSGVKVMVP